MNTIASDPAGAPAATGQKVLTELGLGICYERRFPAAPEQIWRAVTTSDGLARWIGDYSGDPARGELSFRMAYEGEYAEPALVKISRCEPQRWVQARVAASQNDGGPGSEWGFLLEFQGREQETVFRFTQLIPDPGWAVDYGPGWDYYLDRLVAVQGGNDPATVRFEAYHPRLSGHYRKEFGLTQA